MITPTALSCILFVQTKVPMTCLLSGILTWTPTIARSQVHLQLLYPPHNGFGGDEDSLGSCLKLAPKPPKKDLVKMMTNDGKIMRFESIPQNNVPEDMHRKFIIEVYLSDDTIAVGEVKQKNIS